MSEAAQAEIAKRLRAAHAMRIEAERLIKYQVEQAVAVGMSWSEIAECLDVTKQAAHRKYSKSISRRTRKPE